MHRKGEPNIHIQYQCFNDKAIPRTDLCFEVKEGASFRQWVPTRKYIFYRFVDLRPESTKGLYI